MINIFYCWMLYVEKNVSLPHQNKIKYCIMKNSIETNGNKDPQLLQMVLENTEKIKMQKTADIHPPKTGISVHFFLTRLS